MDTPSIFDDTVVNIVTAKVKFCTVKSGTGTGKTQKLPPKLIKFTNNKAKVCVVLPTREAVYNAYERVSENKVEGVNINFKCGYAANSVVAYKNYKISLIRNFLYEQPLPETDDDDNLVFVTAGHFKKLIRDVVKYIQGIDRINPRTIGIFDYVIVDEAHLRSMDIDIILGILKYLLISFPTKNPPNVICTSATYNEPKVYDLLHKTGFKIERMYIQGMNNKSMIERIEEIPEGLNSIIGSIDMPPGIGLVFLPGIKEINLVKDGLLELDFDNRYEIVVAHSSRTKEQMKSEIFTPNKPGQWKIILATNIAETSLTIPNVSLIVDSCIEYIKVVGSNKTTYNQMQYISKDSAEQRDGRTGRTCNGVVIRLMSKEEYEKLPRSRNPEIERLPLSNELLHIIDCNIDVRFIFGDINNGIERSISEKQAIRLNSTLNELKYLNLIKKCGDFFMINEAGRFVSSLNVGDKAGVLIYDAIKDGIDPYPVIVLACMIENVESIFLNFRPHSEFYSDIPFATIINPWMKMCLKYGTLKVPSNKLISFCKEFDLVYEGFHDVQRKIIDCINKVKELGIDVDVYIFDPEDIFLLVKPILDRIYFKYEKKFTDNKFMYVTTYKSPNPNVKPKPLFLNEKFVRVKDDYPKKVTSVLNMDMGGRGQIMLWYPCDYRPKGSVEVSILISSTVDEAINDEEIADIEEEFDDNDEDGYVEDEDLLGFY